MGRGGGGEGGRVSDVIDEGMDEDALMLAIWMSKSALVVEVSPRLSSMKTRMRTYRANWYLRTSFGS